MKKKLIKMVTAILLSVTLLVGNCVPFMSQGNALAATEYKYQYQRNKQARSNNTSDNSEKPNILVLMGDDIGWFNISAYNNGMMGYKTPNIDSIANEGVMFTDFYGEQSCTAGRAAFITGQATIRTGMTKVGIPGVDVGIQKEDPTLAELLKPLGYRTGQFGKNHLGDLDKYLPTNHGFDEFFGNLYHLNAEEEPENEDYPEEGIYPEFDQFRPRGVLHTYAADNKHSCEKSPVWDGGERVRNVTDNNETLEDGSENPNFSYGQRVCDTGPLTKKRMETIDEEVLDGTLWSECPEFFQAYFILSSAENVQKKAPITREELYDLDSAFYIGETTAKYTSDAYAFVSQTNHPDPKFSDYKFVEMTYQPLIELLDYLRANEFQVYICSGGGRDFVRSFAEEAYGIPPENVIGSSIVTSYDKEQGSGGDVVRTKVAENDGTDQVDKGLGQYNDKEGKPVGIQRQIGKRPIMAVGNSTGDLQMFDYTDQGADKSLIVLINHDDEAREFKYNDTEATHDEDGVQVPDNESLIKANQNEHWIVVSMLNDFNTMFTSDS